MSTSKPGTTHWQRVKIFTELDDSESVAIQVNEWITTWRPNIHITSITPTEALVVVEGEGPTQEVERSFTLTVFYTHRSCSAECTCFA